MGEYIPLTPEHQDITECASVDNKGMGSKFHKMDFLFYIYMYTHNDSEDYNSNSTDTTVEYLMHS